MLSITSSLRKKAGGATARFHFRADDTRNALHPWEQARNRKQQFFGCHAAVFSTRDGVCISLERFVQEQMPGRLGKR